MYPYLYNRGIIKGKKMAGECFPVYRVCIIKEYKGKQRCGAKVAGKVRCGKECFPYIDIVYNSIIEIGEKKKGGTKICSLYIDIENVSYYKKTNTCTFSEHMFDILNMSSNVYLLSARLCVLSAQHMNTRSHNVYAEKHMFDFYNNFLRIFVLIVNV